MVIPRNIHDVIEQLLTVIPETEVELSNSLKKYSDSLLTIGPKVRGNPIYFVLVGHILNSSILTIDEPWKEKVQKIFAG